MKTAAEQIAFLEEHSSPEPSKWLEKAECRKANRDWLILNSKSLIPNSYLFKGMVVGLSHCGSPTTIAAAALLLPVAYSLLPIIPKSFPQCFSERKNRIFAAFKKIRKPLTLWSIMCWQRTL